jgi:hypothetical protein
MTRPVPSANNGPVPIARTATPSTATRSPCALSTRLSRTQPSTDTTHGDHEPGDDEAVAVDDPELLDTARAQIGAQPRERQEQRGHVDRHEQQFVATAAGGPVEVQRHPGRTFDRLAYWLDATEAHRRLAWYPQTPLEIGVRRTWEAMSAMEPTMERAG